ncbi:hypothetical protein FD754_019926 [Muntiacus muntjak]|uniref:Heparan-sulfate 6-O-sulfotransferase n=1 Tax=Muntiacus muntjak TaxID=9888 RepID=A0A5N3V334_MUNMU|nr:hypothetical protein FD754_019926 [Muntiacus muntjak]
MNLSGCSQARVRPVSVGFPPLQPHSRMLLLCPMLPGCFCCVCVSVSECECTCSVWVCVGVRFKCLLVCYVSKELLQFAALKNFHYITILRDPVSRYLSEWRHVQRGATWKASLHVCDGRPPTSEELPSCYTGDDWSGCPLKEFMDCPYNLANNRQVRMLSDLTLVGCYNLSVMPEKQRNKVLLESAKSNLKHMAFFGLTEFQRKTQYLFEKTFNMNFISPFTQYNTTRASSVEINEELQKRIEGLNFLDMELYSYAKDLFLQRYQFMRQKEHQEARRKRQEQRKFLKGRFLQTHYQTQSQGQNPNPSQNPSQNPNLNASQSGTQNLFQSLIQNLTQSSGQNPNPKENQESQKQNPGQEQSDGNTSNGTHDYIGSVEKWR